MKKPIIKPWEIIILVILSHILTIDFLMSKNKPNSSESPNLSPLASLSPCSNYNEEVIFLPDGYWVCDDMDGWTDIPQWQYHPYETYEKPKIIAEGNCVDKALNIISIIKRHGDIQNVMVESTPGHVQAVKKVGDNITYYDLKNPTTVIEGKPEHLMSAVDEYMIDNQISYYRHYYKPEVFIEAAMKHKKLTEKILIEFNRTKEQSMKQDMHQYNGM